MQKDLEGSEVPEGAAAFSAEFPASDKVQVFIDDREASGEAAARLRDLGVEMHSHRLPVADFILSQRVGVERKTAADFESSIIDGRLWSQATALNEHFERPLIAIVGRVFERIKKKALEGALISLGVTYRIPVYFFNSEQDLAEWLYHVAEREQLRPERELKLRFEKRSMTPDRQLQFILESFPMIGPKNAKSILAHFGTLEKVFGAREKDLTKIKGIGKKRAKQIRKMLETRWKERA